VTLVIAHRGLSRAHHENSLEALRAGAEHAHAVEIDVRCTHDGVPVLVHDATLGRTAGADVRVGQLDLAEVHDRFPVIATLEEGLDALGELDCAVMLDVKVSRPRAIEAIERTVNESRYVWNDGRQLRHGEPLDIGTCTFQSADPQLLQAFRSRTGAGTLELIRSDSSARELLLTAPFITAYAQGVTLPEALATRTVLRALRGLRLGTYVYTVNSPARFEELTRHGASGIYTDIADKIARP